MGFQEKERKIFNQLRKPDKLPVAKMFRSLQDLIPVSKVTLDGIFECGKNVYSACFLVEDTNFSIKTFEEQVIFLQNWCDLQSAFDTDFKLTVFNKKRDMEKFRDLVLYRTPEKELKRLEDSYNEIIENAINECRQGIDASIYLTVTTRKTLASAIEYFSVLSNDLEERFMDLDTEIHWQNADKRIQTLVDFYQMNYCEDEKLHISMEECIKNGRDWKNDVIGNVINIDNPEYLVTSGQYVQAFFLEPKSFSNDQNDKFFFKLCNIPYKSLITVDYVPVPKNVAVKMLEIKAAGIDSEISKQQDKLNENGYFSNEITMGVQNRKNAIKEKYNKVKSSDLGTFWMGFTIILITDSKQEMASAEETLIQICKEASLECKKYYNQQIEAVNTALPIGCRQVSQMRTFTGSEAGIYIPFNVKECQMKESPLYYGINQKSKQPILLNRKKLTNGNGFVLAPTGYGKSFNGAKFEIGGVLLTTDDHVLIMDPSNEYIDVVTEFNGTVLEFSRDSDLCINPFDFDLEKMRKGMSRKEIKTLCKDKSHLMFSMCNGILEDLFDIRFKSIIERCVRTMIHNIAALPPDEMYIPIMTDFYNIISEQPEKEVEDLLLCLQMFTFGELDMFNGQTNFDINNRLVTFSIRDIDEEYWLMAMSVIFDFMTKKVLENRGNGIATRLYADEFHIFADNTFACKYFIRCWRTWRKYFGFCTGITQNISTVLANKELASLISNSDYLMLLHQSDDDFQTMLRQFSFITEAHKKLLLKAKPGTGIIKAGENIIPFDNRIDKNSYVYQIFNTNPNELAG